jgi:hypothetical protein
MEVIEQYPMIKELWDIAKEATVHYNLGQKRRVVFNIEGMQIPVLYSSMFIWQNERFEVTEFYIEPALLGKILDMLYPS